MTIDTTSFSEEVLEQASAWIVRLRSDQVSTQDKEDFALWLAASKRHQAAFDEMMVLWDVMGSEPLVEKTSPISALLGQVSANNGPTASNDCCEFEFDHSSQSSSPQIQTTSNNTGNVGTAQNFRLKPIQSLAALTTLAASFLLIAIFVFYSPTNGISVEQNPALTLYSTPIGIQQRYTLPDGSIVELNTNSTISVRYEEGFRHLDLIQGEAHFDVKPDPSRPFVVEAGQGQVTAIGTAFNIQVSTFGTTVGEMIVAVTEGKVSVTDRQRLNQKIALIAGQQSHVSRYGDIGQAQTADLKLVSAWREKTLIFRSTELSAALEELNRYLAEPVDVSHPSLSNLSITGTFSLEAPEATLSAIIQAFELQTLPNPYSNTTRLYQR